MDWDTSWFYKINGLAGQSAALDWFMVECSNSGNFVFLAILYMVYRTWLNWQQGLIAAPTLGFLVGGGDFVGMQLKIFFARPRPCQVFLNIQELVGCGGSFSMPSNHAFNSATAASFLWVVFPSTRWVVGPLAVLVGLSRIYLGAHYPTDVLAGWSLGAMSGMAAGLAVLRVKWFQKSPQPPFAKGGLGGFEVK